MNFDEQHIGKIKFTILGSSSAAISMLLESMYSNYGLDFTVQVVKNIKTKNELPYHMDNISVDVVDSKNWRHNLQM